MQISKIKTYFENLNPRQLGLTNKIKVNSIKKLGVGTGNLNYLVSANKKKFVFRENIDPKNPRKSKKEFKSLKLIEKLDLGPIPRILDKQGKFIILDFIEGKTLDKFKVPFNPKLIKYVAKLCAKLHSVNFKGKKNLPSTGYDGKSYLNFISKMFNYIKKNLKNKDFLNLLESTNKRLRKGYLNKKYLKQRVFSQGDSCEQNVVFHKGQCHLIDFESIETTNPAGEVARIFIDFGREPFNKKQKEIFLKEYCKLRKIKNKKRFIEEIKNFESLVVFTPFIWSIEHILKIKNKEFNKEFLKNNDIRKDYAYANFCLKRGLNFKVLDQRYKKINLNKIL